MNRNKDYIPTAAEIERSRDEAASRAKDTRKMYKCEYEIDGNKLTETIPAYDLKEATDHIKQQCGLVGWIPRNLNITPIENMNAEVK